MGKEVYTNQKLKDMRDRVDITSNVKQHLIEEDGCLIIKIDDIKELFVECNGSPFHYLLKYNVGKWGREGWEECIISSNYYSNYDDDESIVRFDESELSEKMINDCLNQMNYPKIGNSVFKKITETKFRKDELSQTYIPFSLVMDLFTIEVGHYYIIGCSDDLDEIKQIHLNCMEYFER